MKKIRKTVRQIYVCTTIDFFSLASEFRLLSGSPLVRPGGGGTPANPGSIQVIPPSEDDEGDDDNLEG